MLVASLLEIGDLNDFWHGEASGANQVTIMNSGLKDLQGITLVPPTNVNWMTLNLPVATDGLIHLAYAWKMKKIRHVAFNEAWVEQQFSRQPSGKPTQPEEPPP